jgi:hypothetical protein
MLVAREHLADREVVAGSEATCELGLASSELRLDSLRLMSR